MALLTLPPEHKHERPVHMPFPAPVKGGLSTPHTDDTEARPRGSPRDPTQRHGRPGVWLPARSPRPRKRPSAPCLECPRSPGA